MTSANRGEGVMEAPSSTESTHLEEILKQLVLDKDVVLAWEPALIQVVRNEHLEKMYQECCNEFQSKYLPSECQEKFGLLVHPTQATIKSSVISGMQTRESNYNALGYNSEGVYLCQYTDVALNFIEERMPDCQCIRLILCSFMMGKSTRAIPRIGPGQGVYQSGYIHPTPGFNSHLPLLPLTPELTTGDKFDRSQVYLYELELGSALKFPRHILPLAVVQYTVGGQLLPNLELAVSHGLNTGQAPSRPLATGEAAPTPLVQQPKPQPPPAPTDNSPLHRFFEELKKTCLSKEWTLPWKPVNMAATIEPQLRREYEMKQRGVHLHGCTPEQIRDRWGFYLPDSDHDLAISSTEGLQVKPQGAVNTLGHSSMGVYLTRHLDVALQQARIGVGGVIKLLVCKYFIGNCTKAFPRPPDGYQYIEPSPGFDSHISIYPASADEEEQPQYDKSQIYLFEATAEWMMRPRQVLPYAIITFCPDADYNTADVKPIGLLDLGVEEPDTVRPLMPGHKRQPAGPQYAADDYDIFESSPAAGDQSVFSMVGRPRPQVASGGRQQTYVRPLVEPPALRPSYPASSSAAMSLPASSRPLPPPPLPPFGIARSSSSDKQIDDNPQLKNIIDRINARGPSMAPSMDPGMDTSMDAGMDTSMAPSMAPSSRNGVHPTSRPLPSSQSTKAYPSLDEVVQGINSRWAGGYGGASSAPSYGNSASSYGNNQPW